MLTLMAGVDSERCYRQSQDGRSGNGDGRNPSVPWHWLRHLCIGFISFPPPHSPISPFCPEITPQKLPTHGPLFYTLILRGTQAHIPGWEVLYVNATENNLLTFSKGVTWLDFQFHEEMISQRQAWGLENKIGRVSSCLLQHKLTKQSPEVNGFFNEKITLMTLKNG